MAPIPADYLHLASNKSSLFATINEAASVCNGTCSFMFDETLNPTLTSATVTQRDVSQSTINLLGVNLLPPQGVNAPIGDIRVYVRRNTFVQNTTASIWMVESCSVIEADHNRISCILPVIPAGLHNVQAIVPGRGASSNVTLAFDLSVSSITPNTVSCLQKHAHNQYPWILLSA